jgi:hypothetical protein
LPQLGIIPGHVPVQSDVGVVVVWCVSRDRVVVVWRWRLVRLHLTRVLLFATKFVNDGLSRGLTHNVRPSLSKAKASSLSARKRGKRRLVSLSFN